MGRLSERLKLGRAKDPGTGRSTDGASRVINHDGTFNVHKVGATFNASDIYQWLIGMRWLPFLALISGSYVLLVLLEDNGNGGRVRQYYELALETDRIHFFPLNWTVVHPIDDNSPLSAMLPDEMARLQAEIMIQVRGYDETFAQEVSTRFSYRWSEFDWGVKFKQAYHVDENGGVVFDLALLSATEKVSPAAP